MVLQLGGRREGTSRSPRCHLGATPAVLGQRRGGGSRGVLEAPVRVGISEVGDPRGMGDPRGWGDVWRSGILRGGGLWRVEGTLEKGDTWRWEIPSDEGSPGDKTSRGMGDTQRESQVGTLGIGDPWEMRHL